jgi:hypothetical protein
LSIIIEKSKLYFFTFYEIGDRALILHLIHYNGDGQSKVRKQMLVGFLFVNPTYEAAICSISYESGEYGMEEKWRARNLR